MYNTPTIAFFAEYLYTSICIHACICMYIVFYSNIQRGHHRCRVPHTYEEQGGGSSSLAPVDTSHKMARWSPHATARRLCVCFVCVCVCVRERESVCVCVCMCVFERERERVYVRGMEACGVGTQLPVVS